jgi:hypothetical protein
MLRAADAAMIVAGVNFMARGLMDLGHPDFANAVTPFDYAAVFGTTLAMYGLALGLGLLAVGGELTGPARRIAWVPVAAFALSGTANLLEDAFGVSEVGILFGVGNLFGLIGLLATGIAALLRGQNDRVVALLILGLGLAHFLPVTIGWVLIGVLCIAIGTTRPRRPVRQAA